MIDVETIDRINKFLGWPVFRSARKPILRQSAAKILDQLVDCGYICCFKTAKANGPNKNYLCQISRPKRGSDCWSRRDNSTREALVACLYGMALFYPGKTLAETKGGA